MNKEIWNKPKVCSNIGGEALIEGVMMRGNNKVAISVRKASGEIHTEVKPSIPMTKRNKILGLPFIRGSVSLIDSMVVGIKALMESAEQVDFEEEENESKFDKWVKKWLGEKYFNYMIYFSVVVALAISIGLFMLLPNLIVGLFHFDKQTTGGSLLANLIEGLIRITIFISYVYLVSKNKEIKRVFQYHGAEHKTIYAYENEEELTVENVRKHTTLHPRCGTTFIFIVIIISIIVFSFAGWHNPLINVLLRLVLLPVIAGISYEAFKLSAKSGSKFVRLISIPGLMLQKITTQEPDDSMLEVAIASMKAILEETAETGEKTVAVSEGAL
ncbi:MAG: DUF1385 domain-containing protein [Clostridiaceae bacterium]|nr:DUF1385 domain-containing protein [Clostridiaceae bacterium]